ncbi:MAG: hypothetical protein QF541_10010, partial [Lentisphaeria bacterium]|nr:hypothetical protein [Lentisphaeria bacterium]
PANSSTALIHVMIFIAFLFVLKCSVTRGFGYQGKGFGTSSSLHWHLAPDPFFPSSPLPFFLLP